MGKIRQTRASKDLIAFSCSTSVVCSFSQEQFCSHLADAMCYPPLGLSGLLMVGTPYTAGSHQKFQQSLAQGWPSLSLHIKPICLRWLDFTFEKHNHRIFGDCSVRLPRDLGTGRNLITDKVVLTGLEKWYNTGLSELHVLAIWEWVHIFQLHISFLKHFHHICSPTKSKVWRQKEMLHFFFQL